MRIVHVTGYFVEGMAYQENLLPVGQVELGHDVYVLTGRNEPDFGFNRESRCKSAGCFDYHGVTVCRLEHYIEPTNKGPVLKGVMKELRRLRPDVLFIHGIGTAFVVGITYKLFNPRVRLQFDCHSTAANSRGSRIGPYYHAVFKFLFQLFKKKFDRIFAIAPESVEFMQKYYSLSVSDITLLPLPGDPSLLSQAEKIRDDVRFELGIPKSGTLLIHTGKLPGDKETNLVLSAFSKMRQKDFRLLVAGSVEDSYKSTFSEYLKKDERIIYVGWTSAERLRELFIASDLLVQPGSLSNSFVDAICCGLPVLLDDTPQGRYLTSRGNGKVVMRGSIDDLLVAVEGCLDPAELMMLKVRAREASDFFGYVNNARMTVGHIV